MIDIFFDNHCGRGFKINETKYTSLKGLYRSGTYYRELPHIVRLRVLTSWNVGWHHHFVGSPGQKLGLHSKTMFWNVFFHKIMHQNTFFHPKWRLPHGRVSLKKPYASRVSNDGVKFGFLAYSTRFSTYYENFRLIRGCKTASCTTMGRHFWQQRLCQKPRFWHQIYVQLIYQ